VSNISGQRRKLRKRRRAMVNITAPIRASASSCGQTTARPAPRNSTACASAMKWVLGAASITYYTASGIDSRGVMPPDRISSGRSTSSRSIANCGIEPEIVANRIPSEVVANSISAAPTSPGRNSIGLRLFLTEVRSPFDAIVARTFTEAFSNVTPAQPVIRLQDVSDLVIRISLPEDLAALARVQPDLFSVSATFPAAHGYIASLEPRSFATDANAALRTFDIEFRIVGDIDQRILPSMTANVSIGESEHIGSSGAVIIPVSAVDTTSRANPTVWIYDSEERTVTRRDVRLGLPLENSIVVLDGLRAGELLVSGGWWRLRDGSQVSAIGL
jgi:hypothetical protein